MHTIQPNCLSGLEYVHPTIGTWTTVAPDHVTVVWGAVPFFLMIGFALCATVYNPFQNTHWPSAVLFEAPDLNIVLRRPLN